MEGKGKGLLTKLNPATLLCLILAQVALVLSLDHPLLLLAFLAATAAFLVINGGLQSLLGYGRMAAFMMVMIVIINSLVNRSGSTVLWRAPRWPIIEGFRVTLEAVAFGGVMALRIAAVILLFALFNLLVGPDRLMVLLSRIMPKSGLTLALTVRLIPSFKGEMEEIIRVQQLRGVNLEQGGLIEKIRIRLPLLKVLVLSSLENSLDAAEALRARGYGQGRRSSYNPDSFGALDMIASFYLLVLIIATFVFGSIVRMSYFPRMSNIGLKGQQLYLFTWMLILIILPVLLDWGWKRWRYAK
ncbi:energy-coupling factor transporter transmembrane protein EcfT [Metallumcola ferriviriculae]|uniref:Energy-coupling factor transporter transmembrane protein EcfT n=1 Tax=Metallumcola ferriviriculae TaxID=3039180 RepID=A0AAU0US22_9FIRM|nr:energy-coupling factor transporter transmembrane protein EcfT [Desulfitibacteraceae bacterium MK1]